MSQVSANGKYMMLNGKEVNIENFIQQIISLQNQDQMKFVDIYNINNVLSLIDKNSLLEIEKQFKLRTNGVDIVDFIRIMLNIIEHSEQVTLYLTIALIDLYKEIYQNSENKQLQQVIYLSDLTNRICEVTLHLWPHKTPRIVSRARVPTPPPLPRPPTLIKNGGVFRFGRVLRIGRRLIAFH